MFRTGLWTSSIYSSILQFFWSVFICGQHSERKMESVVLIGFFFSEAELLFIHSLFCPLWSTQINVPTRVICDSCSLCILIKCLLATGLNHSWHIHQSVWIQVSVLEFKNQITPITHSWWAQFQSSAHTVLIVIMGWIQFIQIAKEASRNDSSLYLIRGLVFCDFLHGLMVVPSFSPHHEKDISTGA